jgi:hypothetical protein
MSGRAANYRGRIRLGQHPRVGRKGVLRHERGHPDQAVNRPRLRADYSTARPLGRKRVVTRTAVKAAVTIDQSNEDPDRGTATIARSDQPEHAIGRVATPSFGVVIDLRRLPSYVAGSSDLVSRAFACRRASRPVQRDTSFARGNRDSAGHSDVSAGVEPRGPSQSAPSGTFVCVARRGRSIGKARAAPRRNAAARGGQPRGANKSITVPSGSATCA